MRNVKIEELFWRE